MAEITPALVGKLREMTNAGLMACKNALVESSGDLDGAVDILRKKGAASAAKKADREAKEGLIAQTVLPGAKVGVLMRPGPIALTRTPCLAHSTASVFVSCVTAPLIAP